MKKILLTKEQITLIDKDVNSGYIKINPKGFKYINVSVVIDILNKIFDYVWSWQITDQGIIPICPTNKNTNPVGSFLWVKGVLTAPIFDDDGKILYVISKESYGGKPFVGNADVQSQTFKSAASDALKKAASMFGIAKNVYMADDVYSNFVEDKIAQDSWTEIEAICHQEAVSRMKEYKSIMDDNKLKSFIKSFCDTFGNYTTYCEITPSNIEAFCKYVDSTLEKEKELNASVFNTVPPANNGSITPFGG